MYTFFLYFQFEFNLFSLDEKIHIKTKHLEPFYFLGTHEIKGKSHSKVNRNPSEFKIQSSSQR